MSNLESEAKEYQTVKALEERIHQFDAAIRRIAAHVGAVCGGVDTGPGGGHTAEAIIEAIDRKVAEAAVQGTRGEVAAASVPERTCDAAPSSALGAAPLYCAAPQHQPKNDTSVVEVPAAGGAAPDGASTEALRPHVEFCPYDDCPHEAICATECVVVKANRTRPTIEEPKR